jgi:hypothetical protein
MSRVANTPRPLRSVSAKVIKRWCAEFMVTINSAFVWITGGAVRIVEFLSEINGG